eukprot:scaffold8121_cov97-Cylindrotheca_fusiformis.AAC.1
MSQYAGKDKWMALIESSEEFLQNRRWKGNSNFTLDKFIGQHRSMYQTLAQCAQHVEQQLPTEKTRVQKLLNAIETTDAELHAKLAN